MKHIISLTESDINRIVQKVVREVIEDDEKYDSILNNYEPFGDDEDNDDNEE